MSNELKHLRPLIKDGAIAVFGHLLRYVAVNKLATIMGCSGDHIHYLVKDPVKVRLGEIERLREALGYRTWVSVGRLFVSD